LEESNCTTIETNEEKSDSISLDQQSFSNIREILNNFEKLRKWYERYNECTREDTLYLNHMQIVIESILCDTIIKGKK